MNHLAQFNQQILKCQEDAYTLAWYLLEDDTEAEAVLQAAVEAAYQCYSPSQDGCHLWIMKHVVELTRQRKQMVSRGKQADLPHPLQCIDGHEKLVVVLIDIIGLAYVEAAFIVGCSRKEVGRLLAHARLKMQDQKKFTDH